MSGSLRDSFSFLPGAREWSNASTYHSPAERTHANHSDDLLRILNLPRRPPTDLEGTERAQAMVSLMTERLTRQRWNACQCAKLGRPCIRTLRPAQAWSLFEAPLAGGLFGNIGVGHGKTALDILMSLVVPGCKMAVLLIPPQLKVQLLNQYLLWREHFRVPSIRIGDMAGYYEDNAPFLHVIPYSMLSQQKSTALLESIKPDLIIADEAHHLCDKDTARTGRLLRYFANNPGTRFCAWSGTLLKKTIKDIAHFMTLALRMGSPLPLSPGEVDQWSAAIDPSDWPSPPGALKVFIQGDESLRSAIHRRFMETRGVVATKESAIDASISISERKPPEVPKQIIDLLRELRATWTRPDGEELLDALTVNRCAKELASGFFNRWIFPRGEAKELIDKWRIARKAWRRELRERLKDRIPHMDSEGLLESAAIRAYMRVPYQGDLPVWRATHWPAWAEIRDQVQPETQAVWIDDYLARDCVEWAKHNRGIIWYEHVPFGRKVAELGNLTMHGGGPQAERRILAETGNRSIVVSIDSHGTGRDGLQYLFDRQLIPNPPAGGDAWEQLLGRLHRQGFKFDEAKTEVYRHTREYAEAIDRAITQARFVEELMGSSQKLRIATLDFDPCTIGLELP